MAKRISCLLLAVCLLLGCGVTALAADDGVKVYADGQLVEQSYVTVRDGKAHVVAYWAVKAMYPDATVVWENGQTEIRAQGLTITAKPGAYYIVANDRYLYVEDKVWIDPVSQGTMVPLRVLAKAMGASVSHDGANIYLTSGTGPIQSGSEFYNATDVDLLARVIRHEAGNQSLQGKMAVGNVILHRTQKSGFGGSTVKAVLSAPNQFTGATNCKATAGTVIAAKLCLDGGDVVPGAYWFNGVGKSFWASRHKSLLYTIGGHAFYG